MKDKFPILIINNLLDKLYMVRFYIKLDLHFEYHQIHLRKVDTIKIDFPIINNLKFLIINKIPC